MIKVRNEKERERNGFDGIKGSDATVAQNK